MNLANLEEEFGLARQASPVLKAHWDTVRVWSEESRYHLQGKTEARKLFEAINHDPDGILRWIQNRW